MTESKHTPTPWHIEIVECRDLSNKKSDTVAIVCADGGRIALLGGNKKNKAAFIVRAANCHEELVACLKDVLQEFSDVWESEFGSMPQAEDTKKILGRAQAVIAKAEGKTK